MNNLPVSNFARSGCLFVMFAWVWLSQDFCPEARAESPSPVFFLTESREGDAPQVQVYEVRNNQLLQVGAREAGQAYGWVSPERFWILQSDSVRSKVTFGRVKNGRIQWNLSRDVGGKILLIHEALLVVEPHSAMVSFALQATPFYGGNAALLWMRVRVFDLMQQKFLEMSGDPLLLPRPMKIVRERRKYLQKHDCGEEPCDAADVWDQAIARTLGDDVLPIEVQKGDDGRTHISICHRADALESIGPCLHWGKFSVVSSPPFILDTPIGIERDSEWTRVSEGSHLCSSESGKREFRWPQPPPDPDNFCYRLTADGAQMEVGGADFPAVWSEGIDGVIVEEEWLYLGREAWILSRNRSLCGSEDEWSEMDGDCSCTSYYLFEGCIMEVKDVFIEYGRGPQGIWFHGKGTEPGHKKAVIRRGIEVLGEVPSWSQIKFSSSQSVP